jgi:hypothetical protein
MPGARRQSLVRAAGACLAPFLAPALARAQGAPRLRPGGGRDAFGHRRDVCGPAAGGLPRPPCAALCGAPGGRGAPVPEPLGRGRDRRRAGGRCGRAEARPDPGPGGVARPAGADGAGPRLVARRPDPGRQRAAHRPPVRARGRHGRARHRLEQRGRHVASRDGGPERKIASVAATIDSGFRAKASVSGSTSPAPSGAAGARAICPPSRRNRPASASIEATDCACAWVRGSSRGAPPASPPRACAV